MASLLDRLTGKHAGSDRPEPPPEPPPEPSQAPVSAMLSDVVLDANGLPTLDGLDPLPSDPGIRESFRQLKSRLMDVLGAAGREREHREARRRELRTQLVTSEANVALNVDGAVDSSNRIRNELAALETSGDTDLQRRSLEEALERLKEQQRRYLSDRNGERRADALRRFERVRVVRRRLEGACEAANTRERQLAEAWRRLSFPVPGDPRAESPLRRAEERADAAPLLETAR